MWSLVKSTVLGAALLTGVALAVQAQSVPASPATGSVQPKAAATHPFGPKVTSSHQWKYEHYTPPADYRSNVALHPYSEPGRIGPKPN
jgi:hypothetical protein